MSINAQVASAGREDITGNSEGIPSVQKIGEQTPAALASDSWLIIIYSTRSRLTARRMCF
jgi:hypothetical protein